MPGKVVVRPGGHNQRSGVADVFWKIGTRRIVLVFGFFWSHTAKDLTTPAVVEKA